jgi:ATP-binding cassette, subfamily B, bacterial PglK
VVFYVQPTTAISAASFFACVAYAQHILLSRSQSRSGHDVVDKVNTTYRLLNDFYNMGKILMVHESHSLGVTLRDQRSALAMARFKVAFISSLPRYFMESMLAIGLIIVAIVTWIVKGEELVLPALVIFVAAGFRLLPILNRVQGLILSCIGYAPLAKLGLGDLLPSVKKRVDFTRKPDQMIPEGVILELKNVSYTYPTVEIPAIRNVNFKFELGKQYAIVGPSGSGKTTLVDICLDILTPQEGTVSLSIEPEPRFAYVPQDTFVSSTNIFGNVALEWTPEKIDVRKVKEAIKDAELGDFFDIANYETAIDEKVKKMSGGQRQRLGLARALYRESNFLVLDEATSALDAVTESQIISTINRLRNRCTVLIVAHRLSTVKNSDCIIYVESGVVAGSGTFLELQKKLPQFMEQVRLGQLDLIEE